MTVKDGFPKYLGWYHTVAATENSFTHCYFNGNGFQTSKKILFWCAITPPPMLPDSQVREGNETLNKHERLVVSFNEWWDDAGRQLWTADNLDKAFTTYRAAYEKLTSE